VSYFKSGGLNYFANSCWKNRHASALMLRMWNKLCIWHATPNYTCRPCQHWFIVKCWYYYFDSLTRSVCEYKNYEKYLPPRPPFSRWRLCFNDKLIFKVWKFCASLTIWMVVLAKCYPNLPKITIITITIITLVMHFIGKVINLRHKNWECTARGPRLWQYS